MKTRDELEQAMAEADKEHMTIIFQEKRNADYRKHHEHSA